MEQKPLSDLRLNPENPRIMSEHDFTSLENAMKSFGDLSGVILNTTTGQLVGGHQRVRAFNRLGGQPVITEKLTEPNSLGTVAYGYIILGDEKFSYREVQWPLEREMAANIAANRISGEFNLEMLGEWDYKLSEFPDLLALTGQDEKELQQLSEMVGAGAGDIVDRTPRLSLRIDCETDEQMETLYKEFRDRGLNVHM